jgi:Membrane proteins related to metalloendopeptidases
MIKFNFLIFLITLFFISSCNNKSIFIKKNVSSVPIVNFKYLQLDIPKSGYITVTKGETIYSIANKYQLIPKKIIEANNLKKPFLLEVDQKLFLPYPLIHIVKKDDTIYRLSIQYAVNQSDIVELNDLTKPFELSELQKIKIPLEKDYSVIGLAQKTKIVKMNFSNKSKKLKTIPNFNWPAQGKIVKKFGPYSNGKQHNDGIDIEINDNKNIKASYDGKVAFVGSNIISFGNMILIKHK